MRLPQVALVDLDNIFIMNNIANAKALKIRINKLQKKFSDIVWFGNDYTYRFAKDNNVHLSPFKKTYNAKDATDHSIIKYMQTVSNKYDRVVIVTNDKILQKLAYYLNDDIPLGFLGFTPKYSKMKEVLPIDMCFKNKYELKDFIESHDLFRKRFMKK